MSSKIELLKNNLQAFISDRLSQVSSYDKDSIFDEEVTKISISAYYEQDLPDDEKLVYSKTDLITDLKILFEKVKPTIAIAESNELESWLDNSLRQNSGKRFQLYKKLLIQENKGDIIQQLEADLYKILDSCHDPRILDKKWDRRGLVYGHVQSGKTANYIGLINRAFDAGYRIVIVLTGVTEDLRFQTQLRIDSGVVGRSEGAPIGIGKYEQFRNLENISPATSKTYDLRESDDWRLNNIDTNAKSIWVIKKNKVVLENLILWLDKQRINQQSETINHCPFLVIDDEADNASIQGLSRAQFELWETGQDLSNMDFENLSAEQEKKLAEVKGAIISAINRYIRVALSIMGNKTFVAYTATPYSIISGASEDVEKEVYVRGKSFKIDKNSNLFPEHFIIPIKPGNKYLGIERVFSTDLGKRLPVLIDLNQYSGIEKIEKIFPSKYGSNYTFKKIPQSLEDSIIHYILTIIIRKYRGHNDYNTLLIHTSHLTKNADYVSDKIFKYLTELPSKLRSNQDGYLERFNYLFNQIKEVSKNDLFKKYFGINKYTFPLTISKKDIIDVLENNIQPLDVVSYHSSNDEYLLHKNHILDYNLNDSRKKNYIVIGGNRLSRGLTLEGLTTSYFVRNSTRQDSLYQMGRWFGYRKGYEDLIRIYIPKDQILWFEAVYKLEMDLRKNFEENNSEDSKILPRDAIIKLAYHTNETLYLSDEIRKKFPSICDPNKLRNTKKQAISFSGSIKTNKIIYDKKVQLRNFTLIKDIMNEISDDPQSILFNNSKIPLKYKNNNINYENVTYKHILKILNNYEAHSDIQVEFDSLYNFINENKKELVSWSVVLAQKPGNALELPDFIWTMKYYDKNNFLKIDKISGVQRKWEDDDIFNTKTISSFLDSGNIDNSFDIINENNENEFIKSPAQTLLKYRSQKKKPILIIYPVLYKDMLFPLLYFIIPIINGGKKVQYLVRKNRN
jgi:hypothetical protein